MARPRIHFSTVIIAPLLMFLLLARTASPQAADGACGDDTLQLAQRFRASGLIDIAQTDTSIRTQLRYSTAGNFTGIALYGRLESCYVRPEVAAMLHVAQDELSRRKPGWRLLMLDCARPKSVQVRMWAIVKGGPYQSYVAAPAAASLHNYGAAVDCTLLDSAGLEIDMGTPFDFLGDLAQPRHEKKFLAEGRLTADQVENRRLLRSVMKHAGFIGHTMEWWHYNSAPRDTITRRFPIIP